MIRLEILNTTPYPIQFLFQDRHTEVINPCGFILEAKSERKAHCAYRQPEWEFTEYYDVSTPTPEGEVWLDHIDKQMEGEDAEEFLLVVGSVVAAQAYPGRVVATIPTPESEGMPTDQQVMRTDGFIIFREYRRYREEE